MNRMTVGIAFSLGLALIAGPIAAQEEEPADEFRGPTCELDMGHYLVRQALTYLEGAVQSAEEGGKTALLADAERSLLEAIGGDQAENMGAWYLLARHSVLAGELVRADTAFAKVETMVPECAEDIEYYRHSTWVNHVNQGIELMQMIDYDGALVQLKLADAIWAGSNVAKFYIGKIHGDYAEMDSAITYLKELVEMGTTDSANIDNYETAISDVAALFHMEQMWDSSIVWHRRLEAMRPGDADALFGLAEAFAENGQSDSAFAIYDNILANPAAMNSLDLFNAGVRMFNADEFARAAQAFNAGLEKNAFHRDALYNLCNTYLAVGGDEARPQSERDEAVSQMSAIADRLIAVDPQNRDPLRLKAAALQMGGDDAGMATLMDNIDGFAFEVSVDISRPIPGGYELHGRISNLTDGASTTYPELTFEFLDESGNVVGTDTVSGGSLDADGSQRFSLGAAGDGVVAWRYSVGS